MRSNLPISIPYYIPIALFFCAMAGCSSLQKNAYLPSNIPVDMQPTSRSELIPIDHRLLGATTPNEHTIAIGDVLGIHISQVVGGQDGELPQVTFPAFRTNSAPVEPFIGFPIKVEADGTIAIPLVKPLAVAGLTLPQVRQAILNEIDKSNIVVTDRAHVNVSLITPAVNRVHVIRQDSQYNLPGLQRKEEFEISRRWSGTTLYLEPQKATVLSALMETGGLPGIDARNEIWVMKGLGIEQDLGNDPYIDKLVGELPIMLPRVDSKLIRIPLHQRIGEELPFEPQDIMLGDGDVVFLPRREGDHFMTGGYLPPGRFPLPRDRDLEVVEAIAICTGNNFGPNRGTGSPHFASGGGGLIPPTDVIIVRRTTENQQIKIYVDLKKCLEDPCHRVKIASGDLIVLKYKKAELMGNLALNLFGYNFGISTVFSNDNRIITP